MDLQRFQSDCWLCFIPLAGQFELLRYDAPSLLSSESVCSLPYVVVAVRFVSSTAAAVQCSLSASVHRTLGLTARDVEICIPLPAALQGGVFKQPLWQGIGSSLGLQQQQQLLWSMRRMRPDTACTRAWCEQPSTGEPSARATLCCCSRSVRV